jgi:phosphoesterase RecJ-like protein
VPFGYLALSSRVLGRAVLEPERRFIWSIMTLEDLEACGLRHEDSDPLIDDLRIAAEADVALLLKQVSDGFKGSLRSRGRVDVGAIAGSLAGGGHHNAAGFTHQGPPRVIVELVRAALS